MIPVTEVPEPSQFDTRARKPGNVWLTDNPNVDRPRDFWSPFRAVLATGFKDRCGYSAMHDLTGTVDHFKSFKTDRSSAYEWSNYRYASQWLNSSKKARAVLDPYEIGQGWFEVLLPSMELVLTASIPADVKPRAQAMLESFPIGRDPRIIRQRRAWYEMHKAKKLTLEGLRDVAPQIAEAVDRFLEAGASLP